VRKKAARSVWLTLALLAVLTALGSPNGWMPGRGSDGRITLFVCASVGSSPAQPPETAIDEHAGHHGHREAAAHPPDHHHGADHAARFAASPSPSPDAAPEHDHQRPHQDAPEVCAWAGQHAGPPATAPPPLVVPVREVRTAKAGWTPKPAPPLKRLAPPPPATAPPLKV
jgi:hypothetical protein